MTVYLIRVTGCATMTNLVMSANKGSESSEVVSSHGADSDVTMAAAYFISDAYLTAEPADGLISV